MGVDYSSSMLNIQDNHAYDIKNFLKENGTLQKRKPYEQVGIGGLNGIWECNYNGQKYIIAHKGNNIYLVNDIDRYERLASNYIPLTENGKETFGISDETSWGVFTNDRLYILCGEYLVVKFNENGSPTVHKVFEDEETYIPTTTIGITSSSSVGISRETLDNPNLLTRYRYNSLNTVGITNEGGYFDLDANTNDYTSITAVLNYNYKTINLITVLKTEGHNQLYKLVNELDNNDEYGTIIPRETYVTLFLYKEGVVLENKNPEKDNVVVKIMVDYDESDLVRKCKFGVMYGAGGNRNRLFISGNPDKPNLDYHTSRRNIYAQTIDDKYDLEDSQDLTYFSAYDYCAYGTSNSAVTDYQIMGDGSLMVLKEENLNEPNIYFRDSNYETKSIMLGDSETQVVEETYPMRVGNIGEGAINGVKGTLKNLNNALVFVSNNGVFGVSSTVSASMLASDYKYSYGRSRLINERLKKQLLNANNVATIVYDHKYFITIKDNSGEYTTYVGDGRYPYKLKDSIDNEYEYEWFVLKGINANQYHIVNGNLYYSNNNGLFKFDIHKKCEKYVDIDVLPINVGELTYEYSDDDIYYDNGTYITHPDFDLSKIKNAYSNRVVFDGDCYLKLDKVTISNKVLDASGLSQQTKDYLMVSSNYEIGYYDTSKHLFTKIYFTEIDDEEEKYSTNINISEQNLLVKCNGHRFEINVIESDDELIIDSITDSFGYKCEFYAEIYSTTRPNFSMTGVIYLENIIDCYYLTKAYNFGQSVYNKHLRSLTIVNDSEMLSYTDFGIITKNVKKRFENNYFSGTQGIDDIFSNIFRADLTSGAFSTSFTKDYILRFNFVQFEFFNENETNCIINNFSILYTIGFKHKGVM